MLLLLAALLGPHAADAQLHARDPEAAWVRSAPVLRPAAAAGTSLSRHVYSYLPYWESIDLASFRWDLVSEVIAISVASGAGGTVTKSHGIRGPGLGRSGYSRGGKN